MAANKLNEYLLQAAFRRGYREAMGLSGAQGGAATGATVQAPQGGVGSQRAGNQRGGMASGGWLPAPTAPAVTSQGGPEDGRGGNFFGTIASGALGFLTGGPIGAGAAILGSLAGGGSNSSGQSSSGNAPALSADYNQAHQQALQGQGTVDPAVLQGAQSQGMAAINAQAQNSRDSLMANLASRGMLHSGVAATGLANVEQGRLSASSDLAQRLAEMAFAHRANAQQAALGREAGVMQQQAGIEGQMRVIDAQRPQWWETLAQAAVPIGQYLYQQQNPAPDVSALLRQVLGQPGGAPPAPGAPSGAAPYREYLPALPPGFGTAIQGWA
jgi:hypothetical protein